MERTKFFEQYKDPRWQRKRLEIMQRDKFTCTSCKSKEKTLNVHHRTPYRKNCKIWEYDSDELVTLCEECHKEITELERECQSLIMGGAYNVERLETIRDILYYIDCSSTDQEIRMIKNIVISIHHYKWG